MIAEVVVKNVWILPRFGLSSIQFYQLVSQTIVNFQVEAFWADNF